MDSMMVAFWVSWQNLFDIFDLVYIIDCTPQERQDMIDEDWAYKPVSNPKYSSNRVTNRSIDNMINQSPFCVVEKGAKRRYVCMEVAGDISLFSSPQYDSRNCVSTKVPSPSAIRGVFDTIHFCKRIKINPTKVEICSLGDEVNITLNYNGEFQQGYKGDKGPSQYRHTAYSNVCYKIWAEVVNIDNNDVNFKHYYQSKFFRNLYGYKFLRYPYLGLKRYMANVYFGPLRKSTYPMNISFKENSLLLNHWNSPVEGKSYLAKKPDKVEKIDVEVIDGVCDFISCNEGDC